jgi:hypothetical protein
MPQVSTPGKPRIFFNDNSDDKEWRLAEKVTALIESYFQGHEDLFVYSPSRVRNVVGDHEELDVTYATVDDPTSAFEFVQVRDRNQVEGRPWIQQVLGQRETQQWHSGTVVSTHGFADTAIRLSAQQGLRLRLLLPEEPQNQAWIQNDALGQSTMSVVIHCCDIAISCSNGTRRFRAEGEKCELPLIMVPRDAPDKALRVSLKSVFDTEVLNERENDILAHRNENNEVVNLCVCVQHETPYLQAQVDTEVGTVTELAFLISAKLNHTRYPITHRYKYLDGITNERIAEAVMAKFTQNSDTWYFCLVMVPNKDGAMRIGGSLFR